MISTGIDTRIKVQQIIENQLPEFILSESPKAVDFLKQYYISQEYTGGPIDLTDNLDQYLKLDNLTPEVIRGGTTLTGISTVVVNDEVTFTISVESTKGFPKQYGLLKIDSEIITYTGITTNTFTDCKRGFSGITTYRNINNPSELVFSTSTSQDHSSGAKVENLSSLFLQEFYKKIKNTFTPGLENTDFVSNLDVNNFIKESRTFYESKGTEESFRILFNALYDVDPKVIDLEKYLIKPSSAKYVRRKRIVAEKLTGDPLNLKGQTIVRSTDSTSTASVSEVEVLTGISGISTMKDYFILDLFIGFDEEEFITGKFDVTGKTKVVTDVSSGASVITVDSTVGFGTTGTIISGINTNIVYTDKTVNQFLGCTHISESINLGDDVIADDNIFGYESGDLTKKVELRITGVLSDFIPSTDNRLSIENETISVKSIGEIINNPNTNKSQKEIFANSWIYNTSSNYDIIDSIDGKQSDIQLKSKIDKSSLRKGDSIQILEKKSSPFSLGTVIKESKIINIVETQNKITIDPAVTFSSSKQYSVRRIIEKTFSTANLLKYGNYTITPDIQNVYNESDQNLYVASNSLPSSGIIKTPSLVSIASVVENNTIQDYNTLTQKYSTISFSVFDVPFITGDQVYYEPEGNPLVGLTSGFYYVKKIGFNKIKLFKAPAFIETNDFIEFGVPKDTSTSHTFTLGYQYNKLIAPQKLLKKFPVNVTQNLGKNVETIPGPVGMLIDGVEIENGKSSDGIFYGAIENFSVIGFGTNYDVINPPLIEVESESSSTQALVSPIISGDITEIQVDPQNFDIEDILSIQLTGGNSGEAVLQPVIRRRNRVLEFSGVSTAFGGGVDTFSETITFLKPHNIVSGQILVYDKNKNTELGIGTFKGSNLSDFESLIDGQQYWPEVVGLSTIILYRNETDYSSGINTIGFTEIAKSGTHKFRLKNSKNNLSSIRVIKSGKPYSNRKVFVNPTTGISTYKSIVTFNNHGFSDGELISYQPVVGLGSTSPQSISGLSTVNQYKIIKINDNSFKVSNAGIGGTDNSDFIRKNHVDFKTTGTGYQLFKYPDVEISINAIYSVPTSDKLNLTPVIQGSIIDASIYEKGSGYGTTDIINYENIPNILVKNGISRPGKNITPSLNPLISNGEIISVNIQDGGDEYYSTPDLVVIGDGIGAKLRAIIDRDKNSSTYLKIIDIIILNAGTNYSFNETRINIIPKGSNAVFKTSIEKLSINNIQKNSSRPYRERYTNLALLPTNNELKFTTVGYSTLTGESRYGQKSNSHSPIIGWAYDGNPIYGPYAYSDPLDNSSTIKILKTGYSLNTNIPNRGDLPFDLGFFVEDYSYLPTNSTDLDEHNGRYCQTPEYPNGVYAYFAGISTASGDPEFPYFIGKTYRSIPSVLDPLSLITQSFDFNNSNLVRNTFPYKLSEPFGNNDFIIESNKILSQITKVASVSQGKVDSLSILETGENYKVNDNVVFDNTGTNGNGVSAFVSELEGKPISNIITSYEKIENITFIRKDPNTVSVFVPNTHEFKVGENLELSGISTDIKSTSGISLIGNHNISAISTESTLLYKELPLNSVAGIITDIFVYKTNVISIGSSIGIGTEKLLVLNKFDDRNILRVQRGVTGTAHTLSTEVELIPSFFDINFKSNFFNSKIDDVVYFNPKQSVGIATTVGITSSITVSVGNTSSSVSVPAQSIYLPNHPFKTGQQITFKTDGNSVLEVSRDGAVNQAFTIPFSGTSQTLFAINKSPNYIGIVTQVGLVTSTNGLFFRTNGDDYFKYRFESNFNKVTGNIERINSKVSLTTSHNLSVNDIVSLNITSNQSVGIGTSTNVRVKYNHLIDSLLINQVGFTSAAINTTNNQITLNSHKFKTGDKVYYDSTDTIASGLNTGGYFIYRLDDNNIKLAETFYDSKQIPPNIVSIVSIGGSEHQLSLINPPINVIRDNNLVFDVSDSSLSDFNFKIYLDEDFNNNFVSTGKTTVNVVSTSGTIGVTSTATLTLNYSLNNPLNLFYNVEKSGFISTSDINVVNGSKISYVNSDYNKNYSIVSVGTTDFDIKLNRKPETLSYQNSNTNILKYNTTTKTDNGAISKINIISKGSGYKTLPRFVSIASTEGVNAKLLPSSSTSNKIENTEILNIGFEYASDKTLKPIAKLSPVISIKNSNKITSIIVKKRGANYTNPPELVLQDNKTKEIIKSGSLIANVSQATQSINSVDVISTPHGIGNCQLFTTNNSNGIPITNISIASTIVTDSVSGIVTVTLATPVLGFSTAPFQAGDSFFVENIENEYGDTFNSPSNKFTFYPVERIIGGINPNPFKLEINLNGLISNPGLAKTIQTFASAINFKDYPQFTVVTEIANFALGEELFVSRDNSSFEDVGLSLDKISNSYIKILGDFKLKPNDKIKGYFSGSIATINTTFANIGEFKVDFASDKVIGWSDDIGKLNEDYQVMPDNDYYQTLSYTIQSPIEYQTLISPVNSLLHTTGLKNFADLGISTSVGVGSTSSVDTSSIIRDLTSNNRVDAIDNFDLARDVDILSNPLRSNSVSFDTIKLSNYFECSTNRVLQIDNINTLFKSSTNNAKRDGFIRLTNSFNRFLVQTRVPSVSVGIGTTTNTVQLTELITSVDFVNQNIFTIQKGSINDQAKLVDIVGNQDNDNNFILQFNPVDVFNSDLDIKILQQSFISGIGAGQTSIGFITLRGVNENVSASTTSTIISSNISNIDSYFATIEVNDSISNENNIVEIYATHDGTNSYISNYSLETNTTNSIGTFTTNIDSNILSLNFENDRSNQVLVRSKIVGFGTTAIGIGTFRFKNNTQPNGSEDSARFESNYVSIASTAVIAGFTTAKDTSIKSVVRVSIGNTSALHQILMSHDGENTFITQYPFMTIGDELGIGTFSSEYSGSNINLKFHPDPEFIGVGNLLVQSFNEIINTKLDTINSTPTLTYGKSFEELSLLQYDALNSSRSDGLSFKLQNNNNSIFANFFDPSTSVNLSTGEFTIENNFFNKNERLIYTPGSTVSSVGISSLIMSNGNPLPSEVYVVLPSETVNSKVFQLSTTKAGAAITFNTAGSGNRHVLEMFKKNEKTLITIDDIIQSPLSFTPITTTLSGNVGGQVSISTSILSLTGISSIIISDVLKIDDEFVKVNNVGFGTTNVGPISNTGSLELIDVSRAIVGSSLSTHTDTSPVRLFKGGYTIVGEDIFFTDAPRGTNISERDDSNRDRGRSNFSGRVYLRQDYSSNAIFDDVSTKFTGIGQTFTTTILGVNTTGISTGSAFVTINGIFQPPTTEKNPSNNYQFTESAGITSFVFSGISSFNGNQIISDFDVNQNELPRSGQIVSIGFTAGLGYAPLAGAAVTAIIGTGGSITAVGVGTRDFHGSGYSSGLSTTGNGIISIGIIDEVYQHRFFSSSSNSVTANTGSKFTPTDALYDSLSGVLVLTIPSHGLTVSNTIGIATESLVFRCDKDAYSTDHPYPRTTDPAHNATLSISTTTTNTLSVNVGSGGGVGSGATITATVGIGGTLIFSVVGGGTSYINPKIMPPMPRYENLPITGVSRIGVGATTDTGTGLLLNIDVGGSNTTGIGSTLFEVKSFDIARSGFGFREGDVFKPVGLVTDKKLSSPLNEVEFTVNKVFTDSFCSWNVGEFDYIDTIKPLQDGIRKRFPINFKGELASFQRAKSANIDMQSLLLIIINGVIQNPGESYIFDGGTSFEFTEAPDVNDNVSVFFYKGTDDVDVTFTDVTESVKVGDEFQLLKNNNHAGFDQNVRVISGITTADQIATPLYFNQGIDNNLKSFRWIKQKTDKFINGELITKVRPSIEPLVFPEARIIKDFSTSDNTLYIDNVGIGTNYLTNLFFYESPNNIGTIVFDESVEPRAADLTAVVSVGGTIQSITINDGGKGYVGSSTALSIASPISNTGVALTASDLIEVAKRTSSVLATANANIAGGVITSVSIVNPGSGYTTTAVPNVIAPTPVVPSELISGFTAASGFTGIVTSISVLSSSTIKFFLEKESGTFSGLSNGDPIYIFDTAVGSGVTSVVTSSGAPVGIGTSFFDNVYLISSYSTTSNTAEFVAGVKTDTSLVGISTVGTSGKFSWGKLTGGVRSTNPISVTVSGKTVNSGLTTFPRIQRRNSGIRNTGALKDNSRA